MEETEAPGRRCDLAKVTELRGSIRIQAPLSSAGFTASCCPSSGRSLGWGSHRLSLRMTRMSTGCHYFSTKSELGLLLGRKIGFSPFLGHGSCEWDVQVWTPSPFGSKTGGKACFLFFQGKEVLWQLNLSLVETCDHCSPSSSSVALPCQPLHKSPHFLSLPPISKNIFFPNTLSARARGCHLSPQASRQLRAIVTG